MIQTTSKTTAHLLIVDLTASTTQQLHQRISEVNDCLESIKTTAQRHLHQLHRVSIMVIRHSNIRCHYHDVAAHDALPLSLPNETSQPEDGRLMDAIGTSIAIWRALGRRRGHTDQHHVTLFWSGEDDGSQKYDRCSLKKLVGSLVGIGWQFSLVGSSNHLSLVARQLGISTYYQSKVRANARDRHFVISQLKRQWILRQQVSSSRQRQPQAAA